MSTTSSWRRSGQQPGLERVVREQFDAAVVANVDLLFQLHALAAGLVSNIAFNTQSHARFNHAVIPLGLVVLSMHDVRILARHANAMREREIAACTVWLGNLPRPGDELLEGRAGAYVLHVRMNLLVRELVEILLRGCRLHIAAQERTRKIRVVAEASDHVRIKPDHLARLDLARTAFLEPRIGARPRTDQTRFDVVTIGCNDVLMQMRPELVLTDARHQCRFQLAHTVLSRA